MVQLLKILYIVHLFMGIILYVDSYCWIPYKLLQYQVGNTSSRKITDVKQLRPCMVSNWKCEVDAVAKNTVKSQEWRNGASIVNSWGKKKTKKKIDIYICIKIITNMTRMTNFQGLNLRCQYSMLKSLKFVTSAWVSKGFNNQHLNFWKLSNF